MIDERLKSLPLSRIKIEDSFWSKYINLITEKVIPYQWEILNNRIEGAAPSNCISNFQIAAGEKSGSFGGMVFQDTDIAKWLEAVAYSLAIKPDKNLEKIADEVIELIGRAQGEDGYINTYFTIVAPEERWQNLMEGHELYTAGHLLEAAVAYFESTGKDRFLKIMCHFCDYISTMFGREENKLRGYPGHPEIELALVKLYRVTNDNKYLELARYFIDERGTEPYYFDIQRRKLGDKYIFPEFKHFDRKYLQSHERPVEQRTAEGHAVRATYMYSAMADLAYEYKDQSLMKACESIYNNIINRKMYITGSIGSAEFGERFTGDYDLPNDTNYSETCATIGLAMFANRMLQITGEAKYADTVERALYNTLLSGISLKGTEFFYVNPLEVWPAACHFNPAKKHVKTIRQKWFGVACCPPNIARTIASLGNYIYSYGTDTLCINQFISSEVKFVAHGTEVALSQATGYPFDDMITLKVNADKEVECCIKIRRPEWCTKMQLLIDGESIQDYSIIDGYITVKRKWKTNTINLKLNMQPKFISANPKVRADIGKVAILKGPMVYCLEQIDNGENLAAIQVDTNAKLNEVYDENLLGGTTVITCEARKIADDWDDVLYKPAAVKTEPITIKAVPYCLWNNRGEGEMLVWIRAR